MNHAIRRAPRRASALARAPFTRGLGLGFIATAALAAALPARADTVQGNGKALITKDSASVQALANLEARRSIVRAMLTRTIGGDRLSEVTPEMLEEMAGQIRDDMINAQTSERLGNDFVVHLTADIDGAWFAGMLSDYGIDSSSQRADGDRQLILVYIDSATGTASDYSKPAETTYEYDRRTGGSYSDQSEETASSKEAAASSYRHAAGSSRSSSSASRSQDSGAFRSQGAGAYGAANAYGSAAGQYQGSSAGAHSASAARASASRSSSASATKASSAYAASSSYRDKTDIAAEVHDDVHIRSHVVYQQPPRSVDGDAIRNGLNGGLLQYDVQPADAWMALSSYFPSGVPQYDDLKRDPAFEGFLRSLKARNTPFFMGGSFTVTQEGRDPASGYLLCSGNLDAGAAASADGRVIASNTFPARATGSSPEDCASVLTQKLADLAAAGLGPQIQRYWRNQARAAKGQDSTQLADYTLVLHAAALDMNLQQDLLDAIAATQGADLQEFVSSNAQELRVTVRYAGAMPLQFALFGQLRRKPAFAAMQSNVQGRAITMCLSACGAGS